MTVYFMGGEMSAFFPSGAGVSEGASADGFQRSVIECDGDTSNPALVYVESWHYSALTEGYLHEKLNIGITTLGTHESVTFWNGSTKLARIIWSYISGGGNVTLTLQYANGSGVMTTAGTPIQIPSNVGHFDLYWDFSASGNMTLWLDGTERINSGVVDLSHLSGVQYTRHHGGPIGSFHSQVVVADEPTIGWRLASRWPNGAGSDGAWTGDYTSVDELSLSDADFILTSAADQVETFAQTGASISGYVIRAVGVAARAKRGASGPQNLRLVLRSAGANYDNGADLAQTIGYSPNVAIWEQNPATGADWQTGAIDALQPGVKSRA